MKNLLHCSWISPISKNFLMHTPVLRHATVSFSAYQSKPQVNFSGSFPTLSQMSKAEGQLLYHPTENGLTGKAGPRNSHLTHKFCCSA